MDSGIDLFHPDFRKEDGTTRLIGLWDMTESDGNAPEGYLQGRYYDEEELNGFLQAGRAPFRTCPAMEPMWQGSWLAMEEPVAG